jgi:hypothetical protein
MAELFSPCLQASSADDFSQWTQVYHYGQSMPATLGEDPNALLLLSVLESDDADTSGLRAVVEGKLSTQAPSDFLQDIDLDDDESEDTVAEPTLTVYLTPGLSKLTPDFVAAREALAAAIFPEEELERRQITGRSLLQGFMYSNIDALSVQEIVSPGLQLLLEKDSLTRYEKKKRKRLNKKWERFLSGKISLKVNAGDLVGQAGSSDDALGPDKRQAGFSVITKYGRHDPGYFFQVIRGHSDSSQLARFDQLINDVFDIHWPLIPDHAAADTVGNNTLYPYTELLHYKNTKQLSYSQWRNIGNKQKALYLNRLSRRVRNDPGSGADTPAFRFNMEDTNNLFQLEAVTEYFMNDPEPWDINADPVSPTSDSYQKIELTSPYGAGAAANDKLVTLPDIEDFSRLNIGLDVLELDTDSVEPTKQYRIIGLDKNARQVMTDRAPELSAPSAWRIRHRPQLVLIDAFGARVQGNKAVDNNVLYQLKLSDLDKKQLSDLRKTNTHFDTIELDIPGSNERIFRILGKTINHSAKQAVLTVNYGVGHVPSGGVPWRIPAGVGGRRSADVSWPRSAAYSSRSWWDHYDGLMFVVADGQIEKTIPWTSYSSHADRDYLTSVKGNRAYIIHSYLSPKHSFIFKVTDADSHISGALATKVADDDQGRPVYELDATLPDTLLKKSFDKTARRASARYKRMTFYNEDGQPFTDSDEIIKAVDEDNNRVTLEQERAVNGASAWRIVLYDGVHEARDYFSETVTPDTAADTEVPPHGPQYLGKGFIRLHTGYLNKNGSQGCLVSREFYQLRNVLVRDHMQGYAYHYKREPQKTLLEGTISKSKEKHPPKGKRLESLNKKIRSLKKYKSKWQKLLEKFQQSGAPALEPIQAEILSLMDRFDAPEGDLGDELGAEEFLIVYQEIAGFLDSAEIKEIIHADKEMLEAMDPIKWSISEIKRLEKQRKTEFKKLGWWNQIILANLWLIRPDERPE